MTSVYYARTLNTYKSMRRRVKFDPNYINVSVCARWLESFDNFIEDMGYQPDSMALDRIDLQGNYEPSNCRWMTNNTQRKNRLYQENISLAESTYEINGSVKSLRDWCKYYKINYSVVKKRIIGKWTILEALTTPVSTPGKKIKQPNKTYTYSGISLSIEKWAAISGWQVRSLRLRIQQGMTIKEAITTPAKSNRSKFIAPTEEKLKIMILDYYDRYGLELD